MMFFRAFGFGMVLGATFPGFFAGLFLAVPFLGIFAVIAGTGILGEIYNFTGHIALTIVASLALMIGAFKSLVWASFRFPKAATVGFVSLYTLTFGSIAYGIADGDWIWGAVIGGGAGWYVFSKLKPYLWSTNEEDLQRLAEV